MILYIVINTIKIGDDRIIKTDLFVTEEEKNKVFDLFKIAQTTPVILVQGNDLSQSAWDSLRKHMDELAEKYGVETERADGSKFAIDKEGRIIYARQ